MSENNHIALARKWRPRRFSEVVWQQHVVQALANALTQDRLHHAYLFTGPSGVGKTTIARIFAKAINCETGITATPCETCSSCQEMNAGRFVDLIEVDAASRTKVEDTRDLLDNVQYAPSRGRFKVYLIDEVHMLSGHSFNALLKTLEEPPAHVKFLLATTDPEKLPITVLTRCLQFHLKRMPNEQIAERLGYVLNQENIEYEPEALLTLAHAAQGSMRDALSLLDQAIAHGGGKVDVPQVAALIGASQSSDLFGLLNALAANDSTTLATQLETINASVPDFDQLFADLLTVLHQVSLAQTLPHAKLENIWNAVEPIKALSKTLKPETVQLYYQIALLGRRDLLLAPAPRLGFEMTIMRMLAFRPMEVTPEAIFTPAAKKTTHTNHSPVQTQATPKPTMPSPTAQTAAPTELPQGAQAWAQLLPHLNISGITKVIADHCAFVRQEDTTLYLQLDPQHAPMLNPEHEKRLSQAISEHYGKPMAVNIQVAQQTEPNATPAAQKAAQAAAQKAQAKANLQQDPNVQALMKDFNAHIVDVN